MSESDQAVGEPRYVGRWVDLLLAAMAMVVVAVSWLSLGWRMDFDTPLMLYIARLLTWGRLPYTEIFDVNLPGTYLANLVVLKVFGSGDLGVRWADLTVLATVCALLVFGLRKLGRRPAAGGVLIFALLYLSYGTLFALQRDVLLLVPVALAVVLYMGRSRLRAFGIGLCFGVVALIKPQACLMLPAFFLVDLLPGKKKATPSSFMRDSVLPASLGLLLPLVGTALALQHLGVLDGFLAIVRGYWPLFADLSGEQRVLAGLESRLMYRLGKSAEQIGKLPLLIPAFYGAWIALRATPERSAARRAAVLLLGMAGTAAVSVFVVGRFWDYHWLPCWLALCLLSGLGLLPHLAQGRSLLIVGLFASQLMLPFLPQIYSELRFGQGPGPKNGRVDELADFLRTHLRPGDTVQPLDWTEGSLNAMLSTDAELATGFPYTYQFHHHVSTPYIQGLRRRFMHELRASRPRFVIETHSIWWILQGPDTSPDFPALRLWLEENYAVRHRGEGYSIHERRSERP